MVEQKNTVYGEGGIIKSGPSQALIDAAYKHDIGYAKFLMDELHWADTAYALMLIKLNIIPEEEGKSLIEGLLKVNETNFEEYINPKFGDIYNSKEKYLTSIIGDSAGWLHIGRPRREAVNIAFILALRKRLFYFAKSLSQLAQSLLNKAKEEIHTILPDYTYLQQANPTTFGHFILTYLMPLVRDFQRLRASYSRLNVSPAGSGSINGSSINLDREFLSELLCFDSVSNHSRDAMWKPDIPIELFSNIVLIFSNLNRLTDELQIFCSSEFSIINLPDSLSRTSVIMPQKKNPYALAYFRGMTNDFVGKLMSAVNHGKVFTGNPDSRIFIYTDLPDALEKATASINLLNEVIDGLTVRKEESKKLLNKSYSFASELSEFLTVHHKINYKEAHKIIGAIVRQLIEDEEDGAISSRITTYLNRHPSINKTISEKEIIEIILPENIIKNRVTRGSCSESEIKRIIQESGKELEIFTSWIKENESKISYQKIIKLLNKILNK